MNPITVLVIIVLYFGVLLLISYFTSKNADNASFFLGNRKSPWYIVAFGMIGTSLSGVTFISVPGWVQSSQFSYMQMIIGYLAGYAVIAEILMPMYYKLRLTSIYTYLKDRFGASSYKTGASFFLLSRIIGSSFRLFLVANVLFLTIFSQVSLPFIDGINGKMANFGLDIDVYFVLTVIITILLIWLYTAKGGIKTIIWTDTLQTFSMILAVIFTIYFISKELGFSFGDLVNEVKQSQHSKIFFFENWKTGKNFFKSFLGGAFITISMTGLDQDMMQKNLSCKNIRDAKKNMYSFSLLLVPVNLMFLTLGALLLIYSTRLGIALPERSDNIYPLIATQGFLPPLIGVLFMIGLIAAAYSSADSALTALTTSFTVDILEADRYEDSKLKRIRKRVHVFISFLLLVTIILFRIINDQSVIESLFTVAGYTYGPLLGLYAFGLFTKWKIKDKWVPVVAIISPTISFVLNYFSEDLFNGYKFGFELLVLNGLLTFIGLVILIKSKEK